MKETPLTYWLKVIDPRIGNVIWEKPVNGIMSVNENGDPAGLKVVETPYGRPPQGQYKYEWEPAWEVVEVRPERLIADGNGK